MEQFTDRIINCRKKMALIMLLNFSDWLCTTTLLRFDGFYEVNPIMSSIIDRPVLCFFVKCIIPLILVAYIYWVLPLGNGRVVNIVNITMLFIGIFYLFINALHIFNFVILLYLQ